MISAAALLSGGDCRGWAVRHGSTCSIEGKSMGMTRSTGLEDEVAGGGDAVPFGRGLVLLVKAKQWLQLAQCMPCFKLASSSLQSSKKLAQDSPGEQW